MQPQSIVLGVDLGTSFSSACVWIDGRAHMVTDGRGQACIPSVVHFPRSGPPIVGIDADRMRASDPTNTVFGIKRLLGCTSKECKMARLVDANAPYKLTDRGDGSVSVQVRTGAYRPAEIASIIIKHLKERAELRYGRGIRKVVLTHPVATTPGALQATELAARLAGMDVVRTLAEPVAGALAAGFGAPSEPRRFVVFDFGGGTLDVTTVHQEATTFKVLSAGGDDLLGGDNFDLAMADRIGDVIWRARGVEVRHDVLRWEGLTRQCELAKRALSSREDARLHLDDLLGSGGADLDLLVGRTDLEPCWQPLVDRAVERTAAAMLDANLRPRDLAAMVPIGGTTYIPLVRKNLSRVFPVPRVDVADPQTVVAQGAAMVGARAVALAD